MVLLLVACLFILSAGFLNKSSAEQKLAQVAKQGLQSKELAYSAVETVRVRLLNDSNFPPAALEPSQEVFAFQETVLNYDETAEVGRYQIHCDRRWVAPPYCILRVTVVGQAASDASNPVRYKLTAEFLMNEGQRGTLVNLVDQGTF